MDEHQIQIGTMPQFDTADFAITDNDEAGIAQRAVGAQRRAVLGHGLPPGQGQHLFENRFGQPGQVIADFHQRQAACNFRSGDAQAVRQFEMAQGFHLLLEVVFGNSRQAFAQLGRQFRRQRRLEQPTFVEQFVEQQREARDLLGNPRARRTQGQQATQRTGVFREQNQIRRTPRHRFHQWQHALEHQIGIVVLHRLRKQSRNKSIETLAPQPLHRAQLRTAAQTGQRLQGFAGIDETALLQLPARGLFVLFFLPQRQPFTTDHHFAFAALFLIGIGDHLGEMPGHAPAPVHQLFMEHRPIGEAQHEGDARLILSAVRQHLRLTVGNRLNGMFGVTQKLVPFAQFTDHRRRQIALPFQRAQHL